MSGAPSSGSDVHCALLSCLPPKHKVKSEIIEEMNKNSEERVVERCRTSPPWENLAKEGAVSGEESGDWAGSGHQEREGTNKRPTAQAERMYFHSFAFFEGRSLVSGFWASSTLPKIPRELFSGTMQSPYAQCDHQWGPVNLP